MRKYTAFIGTILFLAVLSSCATQKKKNKKLTLASRTYHNLTSHYNGYFNANEIYKQSVATLNDGYQENYNQVLPMYKYVASDQEKSIDGDVETGVQKLSIVVQLHRRSDWTDDCYLLLGKFRYLQKDYEGAQEAFDYLLAEYNPVALEKKKNIGKKKKKKKKKKSSKKKDEKPEKYPFEKRPAYEEAMLWMARTYVERGLHDDADLLMTRLKNDKKTHKDNFDDIAEVEAYNFLRQNEYERALPKLEEAFDLSNKKKRKLRYAYIMAQIHQNEGRGEKAYAAFDKVLKNGPSYDMEFNARLSMVTNAWLAGKENSSDIKRKLNRMLKDSKNKEYKDRIYYTLAQVHMKEGEKQEAIAALRKSLDNNLNNKSQKAESYLLLGDLYYEEEEYVNAKNYYDSTLLSLAKTDDRLDRIQDRSDNLIEIAENIQIIQLQDSLLAINDMSDTEKIKLAAKLLKEREQNAKKPVGGISNVKPSLVGATNSLGASKSKFFAYNDRATKRGRKSFEKRFGNRALEDDWRRSLRKDIDILNEESSDAEIAEVLTDEQIEDVFKDVPNSPAKIAAANNKIMKAMFRLGTLFRDKIQNYPKSVETLEGGLLKRYPETPDKLETYYNLYLSHTELKNRTKAKFYYDKIVKEFPNTTYARVLSDPDFLKEAQAKDKELTQYYDATYAMFTKGQYKKVADRISNANKKYGNSNKFKPKFALLSAMCTGSLKGKDAYVVALKEVIAKYPKTDEQNRAREILAYLEGKTVPKPKPINIDDDKDKGKDDDDKDKGKDDDDKGKGKSDDDKGGKDDDKPKAKGNFKFEPAKGHYFVAFLKDANQLKSAKEKLNEYNQANHAKKALRANSLHLSTDKKNPLLVVRRFKNKDVAMEYLNDVSAAGEAFLGEGVKAELMIISLTNYREVLKVKSMEGYLDFYRSEY